MYRYDSIVLGGGPGGYACAIALAKLGKSVALVEKDALGGTCLNRGCIPTKSLLHASGLYDEMRHAGDLGIGCTLSGFDMALASAKKDRDVQRLRNGVQGLVKASGAEIVRGEGKLAGERTIIVGDRTLSAESIVLATGSSPSRPPIRGACDGNVLTSDEVLALTRAPDSVAIIGGGVIGVEFASFFSSIGAPVTIIEVLPEILPGFDAELAAALRKILESKGITIYTSAQVREIRPGVTGEIIYDMDGETHAVRSEACIIAAGRKPNTQGIGLETAGVRVDERGYIPVDERMRTNVPGIYAIGDITGREQLAHAATRQGMVAARTIAGEAQSYNGDVPGCVYTSPELAAVGLTEQAARAAGRDISVGRFPIAGNGRSIIAGQTAGFVKLISDSRTGQIIGAHILAPRATDIIAGIALGMRAEATVEELARTIHPHPTFSEIVMEAAHDIEGLCVHKSD